MATKSNKRQRRTARRRQTAREYDSRPGSYLRVQSFHLQNGPNVKLSELSIPEFQNGPVDSKSRNWSVMSIDARFLNCTHIDSHLSAKTSSWSCRRSRLGMLRERVVPSSYVSDCFLIYFSMDL